MVQTAVGPYIEFPQFVDTLDDVLVVQSYRFSRAGLEETFVLSQVQLEENFDGHQHTCLGAEADPHGFHFLKTIETPQLQFMDTVMDVPIVQVPFFSCRHAESGPHVLLTMKSPQLQFIDQVIDVPVVLVVRVGRALCTGTGPGLTPGIRAGRSGGDAGSLLPGVLPPELDACLCGHIDRDMPATHVSEPQPPQPPQPPHSVAILAQAVCTQESTVCVNLYSARP